MDKILNEPDKWGIIHKKWHHWETAHCYGMVNLLGVKENPGLITSALKKAGLIYKV